MFKFVLKYLCYVIIISVIITCLMSHSQGYDDNYDQILGYSCHG